MEGSASQCWAKWRSDIGLERFDALGISALVRHGFLQREVNEGTEFIHLTPKGASVKELFDQRVLAVEAEWRVLFGRSAFIELERAIKSVCSGATRSNGGVSVTDLLVDQMRYGASQ